MTEVLAVEDLIGVVVDAATNSPRNRQVTIGPSQIGSGCPRQLAYKMAGVTPTAVQSDPWFSIIGTATHSWLATAFAADNHKRGEARWLVEQRVYPHPEYPGTCDLYDIHTDTVIDHKGLSLDTPLPTPTGWTTIRDVLPGDEVFDREGNPCVVASKSPVYVDRPCYRITFEDNTSIIADNVHLWEFQTGALRNHTEILSTEDAVHRVRDKAKRRDLRVNNNSPLDLPEAELPIHPYVLGAWLGDGHRWSGQIGKPDDALFARIESCGYEVSAPIGARKIMRNVYGLARQLRLAGLIRNKHIPRVYLRGSYTQRLELLRGLMDTDGSWNSVRNEAVFSNCDETLANDTAELIRTLGWKALVSPQQARGFNLVVKVWQIKFVPFGDNPFHLPRKAELVRPGGTTRSRYRMVKSIEQTLTVPTQCIQVSSPSRTFLCGKQMTVTHNCVGVTTLRAAKKDGPSQQYRVQGQVYGLGWEVLGRTPKDVVIVYWPRSGFLSETYLYREPYDRQVALDALARISRIRTASLVLGLASDPSAAKLIPAHPGDGCQYCEFRSIREGDGGCLDAPAAKEARGKVEALTL